MFKHILVPTDGSKLSTKAVKTAAAMARALKARVTVLYVMAPFSPPMETEAIGFYPAYSARGYEQQVRKEADKTIAKAKLAIGAGVKVAGITEFHVAPWEVIVKAAAKHKCDLVVMASHGRRGFVGLLLGSETQKVLTHSKTPVLVCR